MEPFYPILQQIFYSNKLQRPMKLKYVYKSKFQRILIHLQIYPTAWKDEFLNYTYRAQCLFSWNIWLK